MYSNSALNEPRLFLHLFDHICCFFKNWGDFVRGDSVWGDSVRGEILSTGRFCPRGDFVLLPGVISHRD